ncbi:MAG: pilus assembly protein PilO [Deltaproteobacteria bacterium]|nr:MAG: pilus assembly protein PilO [Deltaproteobacteria bacterium]
MADLNLEFLHKLPTGKKILILVAIVIAIGGLYYYFLFAPKHKQLTRIQAKYKKAQLTLSQTKQIASQLPQFEKEIAALQLDFKIASRKLPNSKEIPRLLMQITKLGKEAGLEFLLFQPQKEKPVDFYAEVPIDIEVVGGYHALSSFFNNICTMPRIVSIGDFELRDYKVIDDRDTVRTRFKAITYTFTDKQKKGKTKNGS